MICFVLFFNWSFKKSWKNFHPNRDRNTCSTTVYHWIKNILAITSWMEVYDNVEQHFSCIAILLWIWELSIIWRTLTKASALYGVSLRYWEVATNSQITVRWCCHSPFYVDSTVCLNRLKMLSWSNWHHYRVTSMRPWERRCWTWHQDITFIIHLHSPSTNCWMTRTTLQQISTTLSIISAQMPVRFS